MYKIWNFCDEMCAWYGCACIVHLYFCKLLSSCDQIGILRGMSTDDDANNNDSTRWTIHNYLGALWYLCQMHQKQKKKKKKKKSKAYYQVLNFAYLVQ